MGTHKDLHRPLFCVERARLLNFFFYVVEDYCCYIYIYLCVCVCVCVVVPSLTTIILFFRWMLQLAKEAYRCFTEVYTLYNWELDG